MDGTTGAWAAAAGGRLAAGNAPDGKLPGPGEADDFAGAVGSAGAFAGGGIGAAGAGRAGGTTGGTVLEVGLTAEGEASRADGTDDTVGGLDKSAVDVRWAVAPVAVAVAGAAAAARAVPEARVAYGLLVSGMALATGRGAGATAAASGALEGVAVAGAAAEPAKARRSLGVNRLSESIKSPAGSFECPAADAAAGAAAEAAGAALTGALASTGASTGRSVKGSNTGRDAASIV